MAGLMLGITGALIIERLVTHRHPEDAEKLSERVQDYLESLERRLDSAMHPAAEGS